MCVCVCARTTVAAAAVVGAVADQQQSPLSVLTRNFQVLRQFLAQTLQPPLVLLPLSLCSYQHAVPQWQQQQQQQQLQQQQQHSSNTSQQLHQLLNIELFAQPQPQHQALLVIPLPLHFPLYSTLPFPPPVRIICTFFN